MGAPTDWMKLPQGRHIVMAACRDDEEAGAEAGLRALAETLN